MSFHDHRPRILLVALVAFCTVSCTDTVGEGSLGLDASTSPDASGDIDSSDADICVTTTVYLNSSGGSFGAGIDDSVDNTSPFVNGMVGSGSLDSAEVGNILTCARALTANYAIEFTDVDPGSADHFEIVITDDAPFEYNLPSNTPLVITAPQSCDSINPRGVGFVFLDVVANDSAAICDVVGFLLGAATGLDQDDNCASLMNLDAGCPNKSFLDEETECLGGNCDCGGTTQNVHEAMLATYAPSCS